MICNTFRFWRRGITPFLQPFTYTEINLNIIYMATDYSMYKAGTKQKKQKKNNWKQTEAHRSKKTTHCPCEQSRGSVG